MNEFIPLSLNNFIRKEKIRVYYGAIISSRKERTWIEENVKSKQKRGYKLTFGKITRCF